MSKGASLLPLLFAASVAQAATSDWSGSLNLSANVISSNRNSQSFFVSADTAQKFGYGDLRIQGLFAYGRKEGFSGGQETTENRWSLSGRYDRAYGTRQFAFVSQRLDRDEVASLKLRSVSAFGLGLVLRQTEEVAKTSKFTNAGDEEWRVSMGIAYRSEKFDAGLGSNAEAGIDFSSLYRHQLGRNLFLRHSLAYVPAFSDFGNFYLNSALDISVTVGSKMTVGVGYVLDYNSQPAAGSRKDSAIYALTLGYRY